jgi:tRNA (guanine37-N1)-methyltransferase
MKISILATFPQLLEPFLTTSLVKRAIQAEKISVDLVDFFAYARPKERIDAPTFGHGAGMLIKPLIVQSAIEDAERKHGPAYKVFFSPHGKTLAQPLLHEVANILAGKSAENSTNDSNVQAAQTNNMQHLMLICARYEGMDARVEETYANLIVSIGDYVLMGGEIPAMVFLEGLLRLLPGIVGKEESVHQDSYQGPFVDHPEYTEPVNWNNQEVPAILRSGNHAAIAKWRQDIAAQRTVAQHFDWFRSSALTDQERTLGFSKVPHHYAALMHTQVLVRNAENPIGTTSVTSLDIHDIARSARTYGIHHYFVVTPLKDQQKIVQKLLDFWQTGVGIDYNPERHDAVRSVSLTENLDATIAAIEAQEGKKPVLVATSARDVHGVPRITYSDQAKVWALNRPVLLIFGTGRGLAQELLVRCDFVLQPIKGFSDYQHLSVRSAAAVIFDRWLGWNEKSK